MEISIQAKKRIFDVTEAGENEKLLIEILQQN